MARQFFGPYELIRVLGEGGMGVVHLAQDQEGREVALKVILDELAEDPEVLTRFEREVKISRVMTHPNVVRALDAGRIDGKLYLATEFVSGGSLSGLLLRAGKLPERRALEVFRDLVAGLEAIDAAEMIHRDVKPANVLMEPDGTAKVADLGLARPTSAARARVTKEGMTIGTPSYLSPEQIQAKVELDIRTDLYAAGILLFESLAGRVPYKGDNYVEVLKQHVHSPVPDVRKLVPTVAKPIADLITSLLQKQREKRPANPTVVLETVDRLLGRPAATPTERRFKPTEVARSAFKEDKPFPETWNGSEKLPDSIRAEVAFPKTMAAAAPAFDKTEPESAPAKKKPAPAPATGPKMSRDAPTATYARADLGGKADAFAQTSAEVAPDAVARALALAGAAEAEAALPVARGGPKRAKLVAAAGGRTLFAYAAERLQAGRDGIERADQDICLRLRPAAGNEAGIRRISGKHLAFELHRDGGRPGWRVLDLGSTGGTKVDGKALPAGASAALRDATEVVVADVLRLVVKVLPGAGPEEAPALWIDRPENGSEHAYAAIPGRLALRDDGRGFVRPAAGADADAASALLIGSGGALGTWTGRAGVPAAPLAPGTSLRAGGAALKSSEIRPEDQK